MKFAVVLLSVAALAYSSPVPQNELVLKQVLGNIVDCMNSDFGLCIKEQAYRAYERIRNIRSLNIIDGITIINDEPREAKSLEPLSEDTELRSKQMTERLWQKAEDLEVELSYGVEDDESRSLNDSGESRRRKEKKNRRKKLRMIIPLLALAKIKAGALALAFLGIIAASIFKIAVIAKIAFLSKLATIIKALLAKKQGHEEHGWAPVEEHGHGGHGWESQGWGRSRDEANDLAYSAHKQ